MSRQKTPKCETGSHEESAHEPKPAMPTAIEWPQAKPASRSTHERRDGSVPTTKAGWSAESRHASKSSAIASSEKVAVSGEASSVSSSTWPFPRTYR